MNVAFYGVWRSLLYQSLGLLKLSGNKAIEARLVELVKEMGITKDALGFLNDILGLNFPESSLADQMTGEVRAENTNNIIQKLLLHVCAPQANIFIIEDAHWMDSSSWQLLSSLQFQLKNCLFIVILRPFFQEIPPSYEQLKKQEHSSQILLNHLGKADIAALVAVKLEVNELPDAITDLIMINAEGHPQFSEILANDLVARNILRINDGQCSLAAGINSSDDIEMPSSIEGAITSSLERLSLRQQLTLKTASIIGRSFAIEELKYIYPVVEDRVMLEGELEALEGHGLIQTLTQEYAYQFKQLSAQRIAYDLMLFSQRQILHEQMACWLEKMYEAELGQHYVSLASHWRQAGKFDKAVFYLSQAALQAEAIFANREVVTYLEELVELVETEHVDISKLAYARWRSLLGRSLLNMGKHKESIDCFSLALQDLGQKVPKSDLGLLMQGIGAIFGQLGLRYFPRLQTKLSEPQKVEFAVRSEMLERLLMAYFFMDSTVGMLFSAFASANQSEQVGTENPVLVRSYISLAGALAVVPLPNLADYYAKRSHEIAASVDDAPAWSWVHLVTGTYQIGFGRWDAVKASFVKALALADKLGDHRRWEEAAASMSIMSVLSGHIQPMEQAGHMYQRIYDSGLNRGVVTVQAWGHCMWSYALLCRGRVKDIKPLAVQLESLMQANPKDFDTVNQLEVMSTLALVALSEDDNAEAEKWVKKGVKIIKEWGAPSQFRGLPCSYFLAEASIRLYARGSIEKVKDYQVWAKATLLNTKRSIKTFPIMGSRQMLLQGWYERVSNNPKKAIKCWGKGLNLAVKLDMKFDTVLMNLALQGMSEPLPVTIKLKSADELTALMLEMTIDHSDYHRDWR